MASKNGYINDFKERTKENRRPSWKVRWRQIMIHNLNLGFCKRWKMERKTKKRQNPNNSLSLFINRNWSMIGKQNIEIW